MLQCWARSPQSLGSCTCQLYLSAAAGRHGWFEACWSGLHVRAETLHSLPPCGLLLTGCDLCLLQTTALAKHISAAANRIANLEKESNESGTVDKKSLWYSLTDSRMRLLSVEVSSCAWHPEAAKLRHCIVWQMVSRAGLRKAEVSGCALYPKTRETILHHQQDRWTASTALVG